jgi:hypothetical protein
MLYKKWRQRKWGVVKTTLIWPFYAVIPFILSALWIGTIRLVHCVAIRKALVSQVHVKNVEPQKIYGYALFVGSSGVLTYKHSKIKLSPQKKSSPLSCKARDTALIITRKLSILMLWRFLLIMYGISASKTTCIDWSRINLMGSW